MHEGQSVEESIRAVSPEHGPYSSSNPVAPLPQSPSERNHSPPRDGDDDMNSWLGRYLMHINTVAGEPPPASLLSEQFEFQEPDGATTSSRVSTPAYFSSRASSRANSRELLTRSRSPVSGTRRVSPPRGSSRNGSPVRNKTPETRESWSRSRETLSTATSGIAKNPDMTRNPWQRDNAFGKKSGGAFLELAAEVGTTQFIRTTQPADPFSSSAKPVATDVFRAGSRGKRRGQEHIEYSLQPQEKEPEADPIPAELHELKTSLEQAKATQASGHRAFFERYGSMMQQLEGCLECVKVLENRFLLNPVKNYRKRHQFVQTMPVTVRNASRLGPPSAESDVSRQTRSPGLGYARMPHRSDHDSQTQDEDRTPELGMDRAAELRAQSAHRPQSPEETSLLNRGGKEVDPAAVLRAQVAHKPQTPKSTRFRHHPDGVCAMFCHASSAPLTESLSQACVWTLDYDTDSTTRPIELTEEVYAIGAHDTIVLGDNAANADFSSIPADSKRLKLEICRLTGCGPAEVADARLPIIIDSHGALDELFPSNIVWFHPPEIDVAGPCFKFETRSRCDGVFLIPDPLISCVINSLTTSGLLAGIHSPTHIVCTSRSPIPTSSFISNIEEVINIPVRSVVPMISPEQAGIMIVVSGQILVTKCHKLLSNGIFDAAPFSLPTQTGWKWVTKPAPESAEYVDVGDVLGTPWLRFQVEIFDEQDGVANFSLTAVVDDLVYRAHCCVVIAQLFALQRVEEEQPKSEDGDELFHLGVGFVKVGKKEKGIACLEEALRIYERVHGASDPTVAKVCSNLGSLFTGQHQLHSARVYLERCLGIQDANGLFSRSEVADTAGRLATVLKKQGDIQKAVLHMQRALEITTALSRTDPEKKTAQIRYSLSLGSMLHSLGRFPEAEKQFTRAVELQEEIHGHNHAAIAKSLNNLALTLRDQDKLEEAREALWRALAIYGEDAGAGLEAAIAASNLGEILSKQSKALEAIVYFRRAAEIRSKILGLEHPLTAESVLVLREAIPKSISEAVSQEATEHLRLHALTAAPPSPARQSQSQPNTSKTPTSLEDLEAVIPRKNVDSVPATQAREPTPEVSVIQRAMKPGRLAPIRDLKSEVDARLNKTEERKQQQQSSPLSSFMTSVLHNDKHAVDKALLTVHPDVTLPGSPSALFLAVTHGYDTITQMLIAAKADVNALGAGGSSVLHAAASAKGDCLNVVTRLVAAGAKPGVVFGDEELLPLHCAVLNRNARVVEFLIPVTPGGIDASTKSGDTPLALATIMRDDLMLRLIRLLGGATVRSRRNQLGQRVDQALDPKHAAKAVTPE